MLQLAQNLSVSAPRPLSKCWRAPPTLGARPRHHQSRHRPARLQDAAAYRRGRRSRHCATAIMAIRRRTASCRCARRWRATPSPPWRRRRPPTVVIMPGGKPTMFFAILMFGEPGRRSCIPIRASRSIARMIEFTGATPVPMRLREEHRLRLLRRRGARDYHAEHLADHHQLPGNPTGGAVPKSEIDQLIAGLATHPHVAIMCDEIYSRCSTTATHERCRPIPKSATG